MSAPVDVRAVHTTDFGFIMHSWLRSYKTMSEIVKRVRDESFYKNHQIILKDIFQSPTNEILVAHLKDEPDIIIGYLVFGKEQLIHYVYVKSEFRNLGIAKRLLNSANLDVEAATFTHWTEMVHRYLEKHPNLIYDPYRR